MRDERGLGTRDSGLEGNGARGAGDGARDGAPVAAVAAHGVGSTVREVMGEIAAVLEGAGVAEAKAEARDIVAAIADAPRFWPTLHRDDLLDESVAEAARRAARRRAAGAPFAYAVGRAAFRHLTLEVDERVLIPRQETEGLVGLVLEHSARHPGGIAVDVGTGSGAIALALAAEGCFERVIAADISRGALAVAERNGSRLGAALGAPVELRHGSLLAPVRDVRARVLVSNPPYIAHHEAAALPGGVRDWEPPIALFSGAEGMGATLEIIRGAPDVLEPGGLLALEVDSRRASLAAEAALADGRYLGVSVRLDLAGRERYLLARRGNE